VIVEPRFQAIFFTYFSVVDPRVLVDGIIEFLRLWNQDL